MPALTLYSTDHTRNIELTLRVYAGARALAARVNFVKKQPGLYTVSRNDRCVYVYNERGKKKSKRDFFQKKKKGEEELYLLFEKRNSIFEI